MGKRTLMVVGAGMVLLGGVGVFNAVNSLGQPKRVKVDLVADGKITSKEASTLKHVATGVRLSTDYKIKYAFVAADGETYHDTDTVDEAEFNAVSKGQTIAVRYHSHMPSISASPFGFYRSAEMITETSFGHKLTFCLGFSLAGVAVMFCTWRFVIDEPAAGQPASTQRTPSASNVNSAAPLQASNRELTSSRR